MEKYQYEKGGIEMYPVKKFKPGDRMRVEKRICTTNEHMGTQGGKKREMEDVEVIGQYPHHVLVQNNKGKRYSITNAELYGIMMRRHQEEGVLYDGKGKRVCR